MSEYCWDCTWQVFGVDPRRNDFAFDRELGEVLIALCEGCGYVARYDHEGKRILDPNADKFSVQLRVESNSAHYPWALVDENGNVLSRYTTAAGAALHLEFELTPRPNTPAFTDTPMLLAATASPRQAEAF